MKTTECSVCRGLWGYHVCNRVQCLERTMRVPWLQQSAVSGEDYEGTMATTECSVWRGLWVYHVCKRVQCLERTMSVPCLQKGAVSGETSAVEQFTLVVFLSLVFSMDLSVLVDWSHPRIHTHTHKCKQADRQSSKTYTSYGHKNIVRHRAILFIA
jgi:hypothetical protein